MDSLSSKHPLLILKQLEQYFSLSNPPEFSSTQSKTWVGLAVSFGKFECVIESRYIQEILLPEILNNLSIVPGAKRWLKGLINLRGQAIPVIDLSEFLTNEPSTISTSTRILLLNFGNFLGGILIDKSLGLKRSTLLDDSSTTVGEISSNLFEIQPYIKSRVTIDDASWSILDIDLLGKNRDFANLAMR